MTDELSLSEDAFIFGDGIMKKKEMVTIEKKVYDVVLKRNAYLMHEKEELDTENHHLWTDNEVLRDDLRIAREENKNLREALADCCCEYKNDGVPRCYARRDDTEGHCAAAKEGCLIYKILKETEKCK